MHAILRINLTGVALSGRNLSMPSPATETRRIMRHWRAASAEDLAAGLSWYSRASDLADALSAGTDGYVSYATACGVIAALSPRCQWASNVRGAARMVNAFDAGLDQPVVAGTRANRDKAWRILTSGDDPLSILGGPKVRAFYRNIAGDTDAVTVDVWAARAAEGRDNPSAPTGKRYDRLADAYRRAATL